ncbi:MAG: AAA family ATPase, partial [Desulfobacteraceae bacterium]|nr:AAA family ATPase [Desulfobacteraceae bacterium]
MHRLKKLPIGIQTFEKIIDGDCYYVDKTRYIQTLASRGDYYFLSRPRRFGKSLLLSTIKAAFQGKRALFSGLFLENNWDWETTHPVIHISFGSGVVRSLEELQLHFSEMLDDLRREHGIEGRKTSLSGQFAELISELSAKYNQKVVVLVDEYDKPILDNIEKPSLAAQIRDELKNYYSVIKDSDLHIEFVFITGVSKFSKVSLFSGLNNLKDITLNPEYSAICGYTQAELETVFADRLAGRDMPQIREWYNGYNWLGEKVYNPFDILLYLDTGQFSSYWFETGTPSFLIKLLQQGKYRIADMENLTAGEEIVGSFDVENITVETLLFQTGYLTLTRFE